MPRWEVVATFALVGFALCALYEIALLAALTDEVKQFLIRHTDAAAVLLAVWLIPSFALMALAIRANVWRRERPIADALLLTPICLVMPSLTLVIQVMAICATGDCMS